MRKRSAGVEAAQGTVALAVSAGLGIWSWALVSPACGKPVADCVGNSPTGTALFAIVLGAAAVIVGLGGLALLWTSVHRLLAELMRRNGWRKP
jgi:hypothetical protein